MHETFRKTISLLIIVSFVCLPIHSYADPAPNALPSGGEVIEGAGVIGQAYDRQGTATLDVTQSDQRIIAEWVSFDIGRAAEVNFRQPGASAVALNKIYQGSPSEIFGALNANGQIFLVNTNGIVFGPGSQLDVAGLVASTLNIDNEDFMNGQYTFTGQGGAVMNAGDLMAPGGFIALLGSQVANSGTIVADMGSVALASGEKITVGLDGRNLISVAVDEAVTQHLEKADAAVENTGTLQAKGGKVVLTAKSLDGIFDNAINTEGIVEASAMNEVNGEIVIKSDQRSAVSGTMRANGGTINISSKGADLTGNMSADLITARMFGASSNLSGVYAGNVVFSDPGDIYVTDDLTINAQGGNCSLTITAMDGSSSVPGGETGSFYQTNGTISTTSDKTGDIIINGYNVTLGAISSAGDLIVNAQQDILDDGDMNTVASADTIDLTADGTVGGFNDAGNTLNAAIAPLLDVDFSEEFIVDADALYFLQHVAGPHTLDFTRYDFEIENEIFAAVDNTLNIASTPPGFTLGDVIFLALGDLNVSTDLTADSGDSEGGLALAATDDLNVNGDISMHTYLDLEADAEENGTGRVNIGAVDLELTKGGQIYLNGSGINISSGAALDAEGDGTNYSNIAIEPGQPTGTLFVGDGGIGDVTITQAEYDTFIADEVVFGDEQGDDMTLGDITAGDLDSSISRLSLRTNGNIWDDGNSATMLKADTIILKALNGNIGSVNDAATDFDTIVAPMLDIQLGSGNLEALAQEDGEIYIAEHKGGSWNLNENTVAAYNFDYANNVADMGILGNLDGSLTLNMDPNQVDVDTNFAFVANGDITVQQAVESTAGFMGLFAADNVVINAKIAAVDEIEIEAGVDGSNGIGSISGLGVIDTSVLLLKAYAGINMGTPMTINELDATNTGTGDIDLTNDGDLLAASVINEAAGGEVNLTVNSDLTVGQITAPTVNLTASTGSIYDDAVDEAGDPEEPAGAGFAGYTTIEADAVTLTANGHIGYVPDFDASDFPEFLDIDLSPGGTLAVDNSGAGYPGQILLNFVNPSDFHTSRITTFDTALGETQIIIANTVADMIVDDALDLSGDELSLAGRDVVIGNDITANDIFISAFSDIIMNSGVVSADNDLELYANFVKPFFGFADDSQGGIIYNGGTAEAGWLSLKAATGIGTETDPVQTEADQLDETYNTTNGGIYVQNTGALVLREITDSSAAGDINIQTTGDMRLDDTIETSGSVSLRSTNGKMTDGNPTVPDDDDAAGATLNVVAPSITLRAHGDIGASDNLVEIDAPSQSLTSDTGAVYVSNLSALGQIILDEVISAGGVFEAVHAEHIWAKNVVHQGGADTDDIVIRSLQGDIEVDVIHAFGLGDIILESVMGRIMDENGTPSDVEGDGLTMTAKYGIGSSGNPINTEVNTINATAHQGSVYINEADGVTVESIQALGNTTIDLDTGGNTTIHDLTAAGPAPEPALITVDVSSGDLNVVGDVLAENYGSADAKVGMTAHNGQLNVYDAATITARTTTQADAEVDLNAYSGSVDISEASQIKSRLWTGGQALIDINASDSIDITEDSLLEALLQNILVDELEQPMPAEGEANIFLRAGGDLIDIANAELRAQVIGTGAARIRVDAQEDQQIRDAVLLSSIQNGSDTSSIELHSYTGNISMNNGDLTAEVLDNGDAEIRITADPGEGEGTGRFSAYADSEINAAVQGHGSADIYIESEATTISDSDVIAEIGSGDNTSKINISSQNGGALNLNGALVRALVDQDGTAEIGLHNWPQTGDTTTNNNEMTDSVIEAVVNGLGKAYLDLESGHDLIFDNTQVRASVGSGRQIQGDWDARIDLEAINHVHVTQGSQLSAEVLTDGDAQVSFNMNPCQEDPSCNEGAVPNDVGDLLISTSLVQSVVNGEGKAWINNNPEGSVTIENNSTVLAQINDNGGDNDHEASVNLNTRFNGNFTVHDSSVIAEALNNGNAYTSLKTDNDAGSVLEAANSYIAAKVGADGTSFVTLRAYESLNVLNSKNGLEVDKGIEAYTGGSGQANIDLDVYDALTVRNSQIFTYLGSGHNTSKIWMESDIGPILIEDSDLESIVENDGRSEIWVSTQPVTEGLNDIVVDNSDITSWVKGFGSSKIALGSEDDLHVINGSAIESRISSGVISTDVDSDAALVRLEAVGDLYVTAGSEERTSVSALVDDSGYASVNLNMNPWLESRDEGAFDNETGGIYIDGADIQSKVLNADGYAEVSLNAEGPVDIQDTDIDVERQFGDYLNDYGNSLRIFSNYGDDITISESELTTWITGSGNNAKMSIVTDVEHNGDIRILDSSLLAKIQDEGHAEVYAQARAGDVIIDQGSSIATVVGAGADTSLIILRGVRSIQVKNSFLTAQILHDGQAQTDLRSSEGYVEVENSTLRSDVQGDGHAKTYVESNANNEGTDLGIRVLNGSLYSDVDGQGSSEVWLNAKDSNLQILDAVTTIRSRITNGDDSYDHNAYVKLLGDDVTIDYANLYARVKEQGDALVWISTKNDGLLSIVNGSGIDSLVSGKGDADITVIADGTGGIDIRDSNFFVQTPDQKDTTRGNQIKLQALSDIDITDSYFISRLDNTPDDPENFQYLTMTSSEGDIHLSGSTFENQVMGNGVAYMRFKAEDGSVYVDESTFLSESVADRFGEVGFHGLADDGVVEVKNSTVNAHVGGNGRANIKAEAYDAIDLDNSTLRSQVDGEGEGRVFLTLYNGDITNELLNDSAAGIFANYLTLTAGGSIGSSEDRLQTDVDGITAIAYEGDVFINEADGVVLENIQAQNNTLIDIITHGDTEVHDMTAAGPAPGTKGIYLDVHNGDVDVLGEVRAQCFGSADAEVVFQVFDGALNVDGGTIQAMTTNPTYALVILHTQGLITLDNAASVYAEAWNSGDASVTLIAEEAGVDLLGASSVKAAVLDEVEGAVDGDADIYITAGAGDVDMANATVTASIEDPGDDAHSEIDIMAWDGSILGGPDSLISAEFAGLLAQNDIGTSARPVQTDVDYVTAYSFAPVPATVPAASETSPTPEEGSEDGDGVTVTPTVEIEEEGSIYIQEADDLTVGFFMNDENETAVLGSVAANNGIVHITAQGDMLIHSVVTPRGGAYLQSLFGSVYAGNGWASLTDWAGPYQIPEYSGPAYFTRIASRAPSMDLLGSPLEPEAAARYMMPYAIVGVETESSLEEAPNLIAGGFSYVSTPNGTIGVGTPDAKDPAVSGEVRGSVSPLITTVNDDDGIGLDLRLGVPPGYVTYQEDNETPALQIWPEIVPPGSPATAPVPLVNPLWVFVKADSSSHSAVPEGFPEGDDALAGLTLQIGNELLPAVTDEDGADILANNFMENLRAYYELLDQYRVTTMQPIVPTEYYAYHPIAAADSSAFDEIQLDAGAYEYIDGNLSPNSPLAPFFGEEEEEEE
jgi:filamentous hemagglutinin family protein